MYLYGASGHGKVVGDILASNGIEVIAFIDDNPTLSVFSNRTVYHSLAETGFDAENDQMIISIGNNLTRKKLTDSLEVGFGKGVHSSAVLSQTSQVDEGTVIMANATINADSTVGKHCIINTNASVDHDCIVGDFAHLSPNAALAGDVHVGEGSHLGIGCCVIQGVRIGKWAIIGAGAVIIKDVPDFAVVVGNPGRIIKFRTDIR